MIRMAPLFYLFDLGLEVLLHGGSCFAGWLWPFPVFRHFCSNSHDLNDIKYMPCSCGGLINYLCHLSRLLFVTMNFPSRS